MKTKLLRKIRKQYSIYYHEKGILHRGEGFISIKYEVRECDMFRCCSHDKQECLDYILNRVRRKYGKKEGIKIWWK